MLPSSKYSNPNYEFHEELSEELQFLREIAFSEEVSPRLKKAMLLAPVMILSLIFIGLNVIVAIGLALFTFVLIVLSIHQREGDAITATCPKCHSEMQRVWEANVEYFVCHQCQIYAKGRDASG